MNCAVAINLLSAMDARPKRNRSKSEKAQMNDDVEKKAELLKSLCVVSASGVKRKRDSEEDKLTTERLQEKVQRTASRTAKQRTAPNTLPKKTITRFSSECIYIYIYIYIYWTIFDC